VTSFKRNNLILMIYMKKSNWFSRSIEQHNRCFTTIKVLQSADDYHKPSFFKLIISYNRLGFYSFFNLFYIGDLYFKHLIFTAEFHTSLSNQPSDYIIIKFRLIVRI